MITPRNGPAGESVETSQHRALGSTSRVAIMKLVRAAGAGITAAEVAEATGLHLSTARVHLDRLVDAGLLVKARASGGAPGRPAWRYRAVAADPAPAPYRALAAALLDHLTSRGGHARAAAARAGEKWGRKMAAAVPTSSPTQTVLAVLTGLGFNPALQPSPAPGSAEVHLRTCPFLELVGQNPDAMCGLHAGVIRGVLRQAGAADATAELEPFGAPTACVVRMMHTARRGSGRRP